MMLDDLKISILSCLSSDAHIIENAKTVEELIDALDNVLTSVTCAKNAMIKMANILE